ncbi:MAG: hypothetical protein QXG00_01760 [Candidatus Woesearchaeota archaeon]
MKTHNKLNNKKICFLKNKKEAFKRIIFLIILKIIFLTLSQQISAIGIIPSSKEIPYESGQNLSFQMKILNSELIPGKVVVFADGPLAENYEISNEIIEFKEKESEKIIGVTLKSPLNIKEQGPITTKIIVRRLSYSSGTLSATVSVVSDIVLMVPYSGKYVRMKLFTSNFDRLKTSNFVVEAENLGTEDVVKAKAIIDIYGRMNEKLETIVSDEKRIDSKTKVLFNIPWTPKMRWGSYTAKATLIYDDKNIEDTKTFNIGEPNIDISTITVNNFKLGGIAKFEILLTNNWNNKINDIKGIINIFDGNKIMTTSKTESVNLEPFEKKEINAYWDTEKVVSGKYLMEIVLIYLNKEDKKEHNIYVESNQITTTPTGKAIDEKISGKSPIEIRVFLLTILVIIMIIVNIILLIKKFGKKSNNLQ